MDELFEKVDALLSGLRKHGIGYRAVPDPELKGYRTLVFDKEGNVLACVVNQELFETTLYDEFGRAQESTGSQTAQEALDTILSAM